MAKTLASSVAGVVSRDEVYTLDELQARLRLGHWAMREARRNGLPVLRIGRRGYVRGSDVLSFLDRVATQEQPA